MNFPSLFFLFLNLIQELLALGERIGYVSTGLPDELISRCLTQTVYCAPNENQDDQEEGNCIICLVRFST